jgi:hypothetical protein
MAMTGTTRQVAFGCCAAQYSNPVALSFKNDMLAQSFRVMPSISAPERTQ